jgi:hypothetical protein
MKWIQPQASEEFSSASILRILFVAMVYFALKSINSAAWFLYPFNLFVTFLHEFGHASAGFLTGGKVLGLQINDDGSGFTTVAGGNKAFVLTGGYIGSAVFGNILLRLSLFKQHMAERTLYFVALLMVVSSFIWFYSFFATVFQLLFAFSLIVIARFTPFDREFLFFMGLSSLAYIIQDFRVGPSSDLAYYEQEVGLFSTNQWMYIWWGVVLFITLINLRAIILEIKNRLNFM